MKKLFYPFVALLMAAATFTSCEDVPAPYGLPSENTGGGSGSSEEVEPAGAGTQADPFNVAAIVEVAKKLASGETSSQSYYIKGKVASIREEYSSQYGNATFYISDDGTSKNQFYVYRALYLGNERFKDGNTQIKVGDEVVVFGPVTNYNGTVETVQNGAYLWTLNGEGGTSTTPGNPTGEAKGDGTLANPFNPIAATAFTNSLDANKESTNDVYIKGKISRIADSGTFVEGGSYGNATFYISEDGTAQDEFYIFRTLYLGNQKYSSGTDIKVGDEVIICGKVVNYRGNTPETSANNSYVYSLNGVTEPGTTPQPSANMGTAENPITVAEALTLINALAEGATTADEAYVKGKITSVSEISTTYGNATYVICDEGSTDGLTVFRGKYLGGEAFTSGNEIKVGDEVVVKGQLQKYAKNGDITPEVATGSTIYSLNGQTSGGGTTPDPDPVVEPDETGDNGGFEVWENGIPVNWKPASTAGNATLSQSTDALSGNYSVRVAGNTGANKRLAYKELKLAPGEYLVSFYAKALAQGGSLNPGIVPVTGGAVGSYTYSGYVDNISTDDWQMVSAIIEVKTAGTYCFVVMNQKKNTAVDMLIDDFTVVLGNTIIIR